MRQFLAILLSTLIVVNPVLADITPVGKQAVQSVNLIQNPGFENGKARWVNSGGTFSLVTSGSNLLFDRVSATFQATAAGQYFETVAQAVPQSLAGNPCQVGIYYKGGDTNLVLAAYDNSGNQYAQRTFAASASTVFYPVGFTCPAAGTLIKLRVYSTAASALIAVDNSGLGTSSVGTASVTIQPTIQKFISGSGTYTTPTSPSPAYIKVKMVGGGGGGGAGGAGSAGGATTFGTSLLTANGGSAGGGGASGSGGGGGGTASINAPAFGIALQGASGGASPTQGAGTFTVGGMGGSSPFGGAGGGGQGGGNAAVANTGSGGGGQGCSNANTCGAGGGAGGYIEAIIQAPLAASYSYTVGSGGAGSNGNAGGSGVIIVEEYYQPQNLNVYNSSNGGLSPGDILATASPTCPTGTVAADGSAVLRTTYPALFAAIGITHGDGTKQADGTTASGFSAGQAFSLPDYRGKFLRGVDGTAGNDPDKASRTAQNVGGNTGNTVGSTQADAFQTHQHDTTMADFSVAPFGRGDSIGGGVNNGTNTGLSLTSGPYNGRSSSETRPKNINVTYCVRIVPATPAPVIVGSSSTAIIGTAKTSNYTLGSMDSTVKFDATTGSLTATLPSAAGLTGQIYTIKKVDTSTNTLTIATTASQTIDGQTSAVLGAGRNQIQVQSDGSNWITLEPISDRTLGVWVQGPCTADPCTITAQTGAPNWVSSVSRLSVGGYRVNVVAGFFTSPPICVSNGTGAGANTTMTISAAPTTSAITVSSLQGTTLGSGVDSGFHMICVGAR